MPSPLKRKKFHNGGFALAKTLLKQSLVHSAPSTKVRLCLLTSSASASTVVSLQEQVCRCEPSSIGAAALDINYICSLVKNLKSRTDLWIHSEFPELKPNRLPNWLQHFELNRIIQMINRSPLDKILTEVNTFFQFSVEILPSTKNESRNFGPKSKVFLIQNPCSKANKTIKILV